MEHFFKIRIPKGKYKKVQNLASFENLSVSAFMRKTVLEQVYDVQDHADGMKILKIGKSLFFCI